MDNQEQIKTCGYLPQNLIGKGTYGFVYQVEGNGGEIYAYKYIGHDENYKLTGLDLEEIDILSRLRHPYVINAIKILTNNDCPMEGISILLPLADKTIRSILEDKYLPTSKKLPIFYKLATALNFLHKNNILHLDIKPDNVVFQGNDPLLIDFGLSMEVKNSKIGMYDDRLRVAAEYRSPELLAGSQEKWKIYNEAVDVWSFGILLLETLVGKEIEEIISFNNSVGDDLLGFRKSLLDSFPSKLPSILKDINNKLFINFFAKILESDPLKRITSEEICEDQLFSNFNELRGLDIEQLKKKKIFSEFKPKIDDLSFNKSHGFIDEFPGEFFNKFIDGYVIVPNIDYDYADDHRENVKIIGNLCDTIYPEEDVEKMFLAIDLFNRVDSFYKEKEATDRIEVAITCLWIATKLTYSFAEINYLDDYIIKVSYMVKISLIDILRHEIDIIHYLDGILNVSKLYKDCNNEFELKISYEEIIMARDATIYGRADVPSWINLLRNYSDINDNNKNISIGEFLSEKNIINK